LGGGPPGFTRDSTRLVLLWYASRRGPDRVAYGTFTLCGALSSRFRYGRFCNPSRRPQPRDESRFGLSPLSLAATDGIDVSFFSSRYLDVSVPWVRPRPAIHSPAGDWVLTQPSFLIQRSPDQRSFASFPELIAGYHVFRRFSMPRHPPCTLKNLTTFIDHRRGRACRKRTA
jgi:hypothetical protein